MGERVGQPPANTDLKLPAEHRRQFFLDLQSKYVYHGAGCDLHSVGVLRWCISVRCFCCLANEPREAETRSL